MSGLVSTLFTLWVGILIGDSLYIWLHGDSWSLVMDHAGWTGIAYIALYVSLRFQRRTSDPRRRLTEYRAD
jgi:hypothetical protein